MKSGPFHATNEFSEILIGTFLILFAKEFSDLELMASSGAAALSVGNVVDLSEAIEQFPELIFQGNVDNRIIAEGDLDKISDATLNCLKQSGERTIF